jgi:hypothetical protein
MRDGSLKARSGKIDERRLGRLAFDMYARLMLIDGTERCVLLDVSLRGAKVASSMHARPGEAAVLRIADRETFGEVVWADGRLLGIRFDDPLPKDFLLKAKALMVRHEAKSTYQAALEWVAGH